MKKTVALLALTLLTVGASYSAVALKAEGNQEKTIKLIANDGTDLKKEIKTKSQFPLNDILDPYRKGFIFKGWMLNDKLLPKTTFINKDVELKAKWNEAVEVTFNVGEGAILRSKKLELVEKGSTLKQPFYPHKDGYKFVGWFDGENKVQFPYTPTKHVELVAKFVKQYNVVTLNLNGGTGVDSKLLVESGEKIVGILSPKLAGKTFNKWQHNGQDFDFNTQITEDIELSATYRDGNVLTFVYNDNGKTSNKEVEYTAGKVTEKPQDPEFTNHQFLGWFDEDGKEFTFGEELTKSVVLTAKWEQTAFSVTYVIPEGAEFTGEKELTLQKTDSLTKPNDPTFGTNEFLGWFDGETKFENFGQPVTKDLTLVAKFDIKVDVTFDYMSSGTENSTVKVSVGTTVTKPETDPSKEGYQFEGWYYDELPFNFDTKVDKNMIIYAQFSKAVSATSESLTHQYSTLVLGFEDLKPTSEFASEQNPDRNIINPMVLEKFAEKIEATTKPKYFKYTDSKLEMYFDQTPEDGDTITFKEGFPVFKYSKDGEYYRIGYLKADFKVKKVNGKYQFVDETVKDKTLELTYFLQKGSQKHYAVLTDAKAVTVNKSENKLVITATYTTEKALSLKVYETTEEKADHKLETATESDKLVFTKELTLDGVKLEKDSSKLAILENYEQGEFEKAEDNKSFLTIYFTTSVDLQDKNPRVWTWGLNDEKHAWGMSPEFKKLTSAEGKHTYMITVEVLDKQDTTAENKGLVIYTEGSNKFTGNLLSIQDASSLKEFKAGNNFVFVESNELKDRQNDGNDGVTVSVGLKEKQAVPKPEEGTTNSGTEVQPQP